MSTTRWTAGRTTRVSWGRRVLPSGAGAGGVARGGAGGGAGAEPGAPPNLDPCAETAGHSFLIPPAWELFWELFSS